MGSSPRIQATTLEGIRAGTTFPEALWVCIQIRQGLLGAWHAYCWIDPGKWVKDVYFSEKNLRDDLMDGRTTG